MDDLERLERRVEEERLLHARIVHRSTPGLKSLGLQAHVSEGTERTIFGAIGDEAVLQTVPLEAVPGVEKVLPILKPFKLASRVFRPENSVVAVGTETIGGKRIAVIAGPCAVENKTLLVEIGKAVKDAGDVREELTDSSSDLHAQGRQPFRASCRVSDCVGHRQPTFRRRVSRLPS